MESRSNETYAIPSKYKIGRRFEICEVVDRIEKVGVIISDYDDRNRKFILSLDSVYGYRKFDEGDIYNYLKKHQMMSCGIYRTIDSEFISWARSVSASENIPAGVFQVSVVSCNDVFEVLTFSDPVFEDWSTDSSFCL